MDWEIISSDVESPAVLPDARAGGTPEPNVERPGT
jgi:hypothetical protein